jgi:hypothetical protein
MQPQEPADYDKPVAYDKEGRPLYAHPPDQVPSQPAARASEPTITSQDGSKLMLRHKESMALYPDINLTEDQYVIQEVKRHIIGIVFPVIIAIALGLLVVLGLSLYPKLVPTGNPPFNSLLLPAVLVLILIALATYIVLWVYQKNRLFVTNESMIQQIQLNLFTHSEQTVDLSEVKDISYTQTGLFQLTFDYGTIVLTTEGDGRTYVFTTVTAPKKVTNMLNSVLEDFKNHRPISEPSIVDTIA